MKPETKPEATWTDQPETVAQSRKLASFMVGRNDHSVVVEVREDPTVGYYVTAGNLFGSQTVWCLKPEAAFRAIEFIHNGGAGKKGRPLPEGVVMYEGKAAQ